MPTALIDDFSDETLWQALTPASTPSPAISLATDVPAPVVPAGGTSMRVALAAGAGGHRIERGFGPIDLSAFPELRFWVKGTPGGPSRLTMRLGSAALAIGAPGNGWLRHVPAEPDGRWNLVRVALDDLAPAVRGAASRIALFASAALAGPATLWLDDLRAAAPRMVADVDQAIVAALDGQLTIGGQAVVAAIEAPGAAARPTPWIRIVRYDAAFAEHRGGQVRRRADHTDAGHRIWTEPEPWDLFYRIDFVTAVSAQQAAMLDFTIDMLGGRSLLPVDGLGLRIERVPNVMPDDALTPGPLLRYRVAAWAERRGHITVAPVSTVQIATAIAG